MSDKPWVAVLASCTVHRVSETVLRGSALGEMEIKCTSHNFIVLAIFVPKIIKVGRNLTKFSRKQF